MVLSVLVVVGASHIDFTIYVSRIPRIGETVVGGYFRRSLGGKGANQAVAASRLGVKTYLVSMVGNDVFGDEVIKILKNEGVNVDYVFRDPKRHTGIAFILVDRNGKNIIAVASGADESLSPVDVAKALSSLKPKVLLVQLEVPIGSVYEALKRAKELGATTILNPAPYRDFPADMLRYVDVLTPNEVELSMLVHGELHGIDDYITASRKLLSLGAKAVITTLGSEGALLVTRGKHIQIPAFSVRVVDTVGAGDAFNGALASALIEGLSLEEAVRFANAAAALSVSRYGAAESMPYKDEVLKLLGQY